MEAKKDRLKCLRRRQIHSPPKQVLFDAGCADYQDESAHIAIAEAAENLMRVGSDSTDDDAE